MMEVLLAVFGILFLLVFLKVIDSRSFSVVFSGMIRHIVPEMYSISQVMFIYFHDDYWEHGRKKPEYFLILAAPLLIPAIVAVSLLQDPNEDEELINSYIRSKYRDTRKY